MLFQLILNQSMKSLNNTISSFEGTDLNSLIQILEAEKIDLTTTYTETLTSDEQIAIEFLYDLALSLLEFYFPQDGEIVFRSGGCKLGNWLDDVMRGAQIGGIAGTILSEIFKNDGNDQTPGEVVINVLGQVVSISLTVIGTVLGGLVGGIAGLFNGNDCDCEVPQGISVVAPTGCTPTFMLHTWGAGEDAEFYDWIVNEGNNSASFPGQSALLSTPVTQTSPETPLIVVVTTLCAEALGDPIAMAENTITQEINLFNVPFAQVGDIMVISNYNLSTTLNTSVGNTDYFSVSSTAGMSNVTFSVSVMPPHLGTVTQTGVNSFAINWLNVGGGSITFTGTNVCSGFQNSTNAVINVSQ